MRQGAVHVTFAWFFVAVLSVVGCESSSDSGGGGNMSMQELSAKIEGKPAAAEAASATTASPASSETPAPAGAATTEPATQVAADANTIPADAKRASDQGVQHTQGGYMGAVIGANRSIRQRVADLSWQKSVQLYEATNGHKPRNTQEFVEHMRGERTPLPELEPGYTYLYIPDEGQFGELYSVPINEAPAGPTQGGQPSSSR